MLRVLKWPVFVAGRFDSEGYDSIVHMDPEDLVLGFLLYEI